MMIGLLVSSVVSGQLVSKTRSYKWLSTTGALLVAVALVLLSTMTPSLPVGVPCGCLSIMGVGLGMSCRSS